MKEMQSSSPFSYLVFNPISNLDPQLSRFRSMEIPTSSLVSKKHHEDSSSGSENEIDRYSPPPPDLLPKKALSSVLHSLILPKNPLSDIGEPSEKRLLRITNSPNVGAMTELRLHSKGLSRFESSSKLNLSSLLNLSTLDLSNNYLTIIDDIAQCKNLSCLNISNNMITVISPLSVLTKLVTFKASNNKIQSIKPLECCERLHKLSVYNNKLSSFESTLLTLKSLQKLKYLNVYSNPCVYKTKEANEKLIAALDLIKLNKKLVGGETHPNPFHRVNVYKRKEKEENNNEGLKSQIAVIKEENLMLKQELENALKVLERLNASKDVIFDN